MRESRAGVVKIEREDGRGRRSEVPLSDPCRARPFAGRKHQRPGGTAPPGAARGYLEGERRGPTAEIALAGRRGSASARGPLPLNRGRPDFVCLGRAT
jgi:hypothetical protein